MKFLANENFPMPSVKLLREIKINIESITEYSPGISDIQVIQIAQKEKRIILTFDKDYGELIFRHNIKQPPAVVFFRFKGASPTFAGDLLKKIIVENEIKLENTFTVVEENNLRQRLY
jgi:predicted nuclease of predicted toxin-antitoxin system